LDWLATPNFKAALRGRPPMMLLADGAPDVLSGAAPT
jgi:hypothetical protein